MLVRFYNLCGVHQNHLQMNTTNILRPYYIFILSFAFFAAGCKKPKADATPVIEVSDYVSGQPIAGAEIWKISRSDFDITCLCYWTVTETQIGTTDGNGQFKGDVSNPKGELQIRKAGYYNAGTVSNYSIYEQMDEKSFFRLLKRATIRITKNSSGAYPEPLLELRVFLKDGTNKRITSEGLPLHYLVPSPIDIAGIGDLQNRIIVLNGTNIVTQTDFFVPANAIKEITLNY